MNLLFRYITKATFKISTMDAAATLRRALDLTMLAVGELAD
jgi:hypothetical protein